MLVVAHLSDPHLGAHRADLVDSLLTDVTAQRPDLVVVSGDWTQRARRAQFAGARELLGQLPGPVLAVAGNHDVPLLDLPQRLLAPTRRYRRYITAELDPVVAMPGLVAVGLHSMPRWRWKAGHVSARQAELVREAFARSGPGDWRILVTHHPVLPRGLSRLAGRRRLVGVLARAGVTILLSGHTHTASSTLEPSGATGACRLLSVVAGTATSTRTRGTPNSYSVLRIDGPLVVGAGVTVEVRSPGAQGWAAASRTRLEVLPGLELGAIGG